MALLNAHRRKVIASVCLGTWFFAFFVAIAHACDVEAALGPLQHAVAAPADCQDQSDKDALPGCKQLCADDLPVLAKLQAVQDQTGGQALPPPSLGAPLVLRVSWAPQVRHLHPLPDFAPNIRSVRLAL
jgi:hypothetical protein